MQLKFAMRLNIEELFRSDAISESVMKFCLFSFYSANNATFKAIFELSVLHLRGKFAYPILTITPSS